jgi:hypothetical protein
MEHGPWSFAANHDFAPRHANGAAIEFELAAAFAEVLGVKKTP